jgi:sulfoxide reductase heme-binding subunit YedZ
MLRTVRPLVYLLAAGLTAWVYVASEGPFGAALVRTLWLGLLATGLLYLALLPGPLYAVFPRAPGRTVFLHARRALGVSSAVLAVLHGHDGLFGWVGGFEGLEVWSWDYQLSLGLGALSTGILLVLAATSTDAAVRALGARWQRLHRWVYAAGVLAYVHAATITIHVVDLGPWLVGSFGVLVVLLLLEALRAHRRAVALERPGRAWVLWPAFALACGLAYWSHFLISHHRH